MVIRTRAVAAVVIFAEIAKSQFLESLSNAAPTKGGQCSGRQFVLLWANSHRSHEEGKAANVLAGPAGGLAPARPIERPRTPRASAGTCETKPP